MKTLTAPAAPRFKACPEAETLDETLQKPFEQLLWEWEERNAPTTNPGLSQEWDEYSAARKRFIDDYWTEYAAYMAETYDNK